VFTQKLFQTLPNRSYKPLSEEKWTPIALFTPTDGEAVTARFSLVLISTLGAIMEKMSLPEVQSMSKELSRFGVLQSIV
jgi:hypothetical protein